MLQLLLREVDWILCPEGLFFVNPNVCVSVTKKYLSIEGEGKGCEGLCYWCNYCGTTKLIHRPN